uniref:Uncharacterized protein n=1 Tax=Daphnia galeata TaxID=27404 RepID=A0A8J2WQK9_9CRUS|nr:unnamed protein product [Daphnia galeata]
MENDQIWNVFESQGLKLPEYLIKLLLCSGYDNLQSLCKLTTQQLIEEIENYATDCLDASDLGFSEDEAKYYFSNRTMKFNILPGHKHILIAAAEMAIKLLQHSDNVEDEFEKAPLENDHSIIDDEKSTQHNGLHFLSEFSTLGNRGKTISTPPNSHSEPIVSVEEEQNSLVEFLKTWIARKSTSISTEIKQSVNPDRYLFVCLPALQHNDKGIQKAEWSELECCQCLPPHYHRSFSGNVKITQKVQLQCPQPFDAAPLIRLIAE